MDLSLTTEEAAFRDECRTWLRDNLPWDYGTGLPPMFDDLAGEVAFLRDWQRRLAGAGLVGVTWPVEFGGRGADPMHHYLVQEELARARAPELVGRIGVNLVGPTLLVHGTSGQRQRWLPGILPADHLCCQLFSEPGAGSDLAAVATRAVGFGARLSVDTSNHRIMISCKTSSKRSPISRSPRTPTRWISAGWFRGLNSTLISPA